MKPRRAERAGANRCAAACGGGRRGGEVKKQEAARSAPSEQCDYVSEGQLQVLLPLPKQSSEIVGIYRLQGFDFILRYDAVFSNHHLCRWLSSTLDSHVLPNVIKSPLKILICFRRSKTIVCKDSISACERWLHDKLRQKQPLHLLAFILFTWKGYIKSTI